jgi:tetratricopeptide (TPR) repeat protein
MTHRPKEPARLTRYPPVVGPRLGRLLSAVFAGFVLLTVNALYLLTITSLEAFTGRGYQDYFYQLMFLLHLTVGLVIILPVVVFGMAHLRKAWRRPNRRAIRAGVALYATALLLMLSGLLLARFEFFEIRDPNIRSLAYWVHLVSPLVVIWLFILHRLAGTGIRWSLGRRWGGVALSFTLLMLFWHGYQQLSGGPSPADLAGADPVKDGGPFSPSLAQTATGKLIPAESLMTQDYCAQCHQDISERWAHSAHRFSSFNNPAYRFSVGELRQAALQRDGSVRPSRFCAGCHDPVPLFSGAFDDPELEQHHPAMAEAGLTCTACHGITRINSPLGNADYTIEEPRHYPFAFSDNRLLRAVSRQLIKAKPAFHKQTFLKPLHKTPEFCGLCHKVHIPAELNQYKWLRGQNHYDSFLLSGVSGHGVASFYYPPQAAPSCGTCHMSPKPSGDFGARVLDGSKELKIHDHLFPAANTAIPHLLDLPPWVNETHRAFLDRAVRVDIFGLKQGGAIDGAMQGPIRPSFPRLQPGGRYLLEVVIATERIGHRFTEGTSDSNNLWLDVKLTSGDRVIGRSGGLGERGEVDPWSYFANTYLLDREGNRIDRRNAQDIFVALYNHQIPPGAAEVVHYSFDVPPGVEDVITIEAKLQYRKFDTTYLRHLQGETFVNNDLPITTLAEDRVSLPVAATPMAATAVEPSGRDATTPQWKRWNDYGIGLLRKGDQDSGRGELRQAEEAFAQVERLAQGQGALNLARVYLTEGRLEEAARALSRAAGHESPAPPWSVAWFSALVDKQRGYLDEAIENLNAILATQFPDARRRGFDFSKDYRVINELGQTLFERAKQERGERRRKAREALLHEAKRWFHKTLEIDPENLLAHYNLALIYARLGNQTQARLHRIQHGKYKPDDNARERAVAIHRRAHPAANHAAEAVAIYDLQRRGAYGLDDGVSASEKLATNERLTGQPTN